MNKAYFCCLNVLAKLPVFFQIFSDEVRALRFNETKITTKYALHPDNFVTEGNHELNKEKHCVVSNSAGF